MRSVCSYLLSRAFIAFAVAVVCQLLPPVHGFDIPNPLKGMLPPTSNIGLGQKLKPNRMEQTKAELIDAISFTNNGKDATVETQARVLNLVRSLETNAPVSDTILTNLEEAKALDGVWYLQYTSPSDVGSDDTDLWTPENLSEAEEKIDSRKVNSKGTVSASGIQVDTSNRLTLQIFDVVEQRVTNTVEQDFGTVRVAGTIRPSETEPTRAIVGFDTCEITLNALGGKAINLGFLFSILEVVRGTPDNGWLETTYLDEELRIGRGNKGSMFVLTRDRSAVQA